MENYFRGGEHRRQDAREFFMSAAGQERDDGARGIELMPTTKLGAVITRINRARERMADEFYVRDAALCVPLRLERQEREQQINVAAHRTDAMRAPSPELRADVVDHFQPAPVQRAREPQVEVGPINEHDRIGAARECGVTQQAEHAPELRQRAPDLKE